MLSQSFVIALKSFSDKILIPIPLFINSSAFLCFELFVYPASLVVSCIPITHIVVFLVTEFETLQPNSDAIFPASALGICKAPVNTMFSP